MPMLNFQNPVRFDFGSVKKLPEVLQRQNIQRPFLVTDHGLLDSGLLERVTDVLNDLSQATIYDGTPGNPTEEAVNEALASYHAEECDGVVCIGGGSPMDLGKAVALLAVSGGLLSQYDPLQGGNKLVKGVAPLIAIPTTAGTGSEASLGFVISMSDGRKLTFANPKFLPKMAICDPEMTLGLPPLLTAATGMDAITHCIEAVLASPVNPPADGIGLDGLWRGWQHLRRAVNDGNDRTARWEMMMASTEGALAFVKGLGAVHSMSHAAGRIKELRLHHGTLNAVILPTVLRFNESACASKYPRLRQAMGLSPDADLASEVEQMNADIGLPSGLAAMGLSEELIDDMVPHAVADMATMTNPKPINAEDFSELFRLAM
ncbi:MAG: iron-containing alcohol dehydrogenase [Gammaproteobacteria bacterium]|nr:iron-containing alcohol dehydrogenase [Gammaproteobacteria bacterium]MCY4357699.1 iron-containing alcohol dehydrogenase [Gammaproteobacteria bacterium]